MSTFTDILSNLTALGFSNPSANGIFKQIASALSVTIDNTTTEIANSENTINEIINSQRYGKSGYYTSKALAFQYGDSLIEDSSTLDYIYENIDATKQIIKQAAFEDISGNLYLKIASEDSSGNLIALTAAQLSAFTNYFTTFEIPGLPVSIISSDGNELSFNCKITYYATYDYASIVSNIQNALTSFKQSFAYNGVFYSGDLESYLKNNVSGLRDVYVYNTTIDGSIFDGNTSLDSGYFNYISSIFDQISYVAV